MQHFAAINQKQLQVKASCDIAVANYGLLQAGEMGTKHLHSLKVWQALLLQRATKTQILQLLYH